MVPIGFGLFSFLDNVNTAHRFVDADVSLGDLDTSQEDSQDDSQLEDAEKSEDAEKGEEVEEVKVVEEVKTEEVAQVPLSGCLSQSS